MMDIANRAGLVLAATLVLGASGTLAQGKTCQLVAEDSPHVQRCKVIIGYSGGKRIGEFQIAEGFDRKEVGTTESCKLNSRYYSEIGKIIAPDKVQVGKRTFVLSADCRDSKEM